MVTNTKPKARQRQRPDTSAPDTGCSVWERCVSCPWSQCIAELPASEHTQFVAALKTVRQYLAEPDGTLT